MKQNLASRVSARAAATGTPEGKASSLFPKRQVVAVVEDDPSMSKSIRRLLNAYGLDADTYPTAEAFLGRDPDSLVACVILDIDLPGMSGLELRQQLAATHVDLPVIFVTGIDDDVVETKAIQLGCVA